MTSQDSLNVTFPTASVADELLAHVLECGALGGRFACELQRPAPSILTFFLQWCVVGGGGSMRCRPSGSEPFTMRCA
jgi:hypothetical protein